MLGYHVGMQSFSDGDPATDCDAEADSRDRVGLRRRHARLWYKYDLAGKGAKLTFLRPTRVKRVSAFQTDLYWNDGHTGSYPSWYLRENCPCASCVEEFTGRRLILQGSIPAGIERTGVEPVGNYALRFSFGDGHDTGIYSFDYLRRICPCAQCLPDGLQEPPPRVTRPGSFEA